MAKKLVKLTESDLHRIIKESINNVLTELDWKTYANAEKKMRGERGDADYWRNKGVRGFDSIRKAANARERAERLGDAAKKAFNRDYGYKNGDYWDNDYVEVGLGGDFDSTEEFAPHAVGYRSKGYGNPAKYEHGWSDYPMEHMEPEEFFNANSDASEAYRNADAEWKDYKKGNYEYKKGKGWAKK